MTTTFIPVGEAARNKKALDDIRAVLNTDETFLVDPRSAALALGAALQRIVNILQGLEPTPHAQEATPAQPEGHGTAGQGEG